MNSNSKDDGKALLIQMDPTLDYLYFMFKCDSDDKLLDVSDYKIVFDIYYTQEQFDNASFQTIYYLQELGTESFKNTYKCYNQFIMYQLTYSNYYQQICEIDGICTLIVYLEKVGQDVDYHFNFFDYKQQNGYMVQNTPTNFNSYMQQGYQSIIFSKLFVVQKSFPGFILKFEFEYSSELVQQLGSKIYKENLAFIAGQEIADNVKIRIQSNTSPDKSFEFMPLYAADFEEMSLMQCDECYIQIQIFYNSDLATSLTIKDYLTFQFAQNHNAEDDLIIPYTGGYMLTRIYFPETISFAQIFQKESQQYDIQKIQSTYSNVILYPNNDEVLSNSLIKLKTTGKAFKGNFLQQNLNQDFIYLFSLNKNLIDMPYGINYDSKMEVYQFQDNIDILYTETPFMFMYKAESGSNVINFNKAVENSSIYVNYCKSEDVKSCELPTAGKNQTALTREEHTNNYKLELEKRLSDDQYMAVLVSNEQFYVSTENSEDFSAGDLQILNAVKQELVVSDKYIFESSIPPFVFILVIELVCMLLLLGFCNLQYYWKKKEVTETIKEKIKNYLNSCKK